MSSQKLDLKKTRKRKRETKLNEIDDADIFREFLSAQNLNAYYIIEKYVIIKGMTRYF